MSEETTTDERRATYLSHRWTGGIASSPADPPDFVRYCLDCGVEDLGDPDEFEYLDYPTCE